MNSLKLRTAIILLVLSCTGLQAQEGDDAKFGSNKQRTLENLSMYQEYFKQNAFKEALNPWRVVFREAPLASGNVYLNGVTMFKHFYNEAKTPEERKAMVDTIMLIYDQRIESKFGRRGEILTRKALDLNALDNTREQEVYEFLLEAIGLEKNRIIDAGIQIFMVVSEHLFKQEKLSKELMIDNFGKAMEVLEIKLKEASNKESIQKIIDEVQFIFTSSGAADCETLVPILSKKFEQDSDNTENIKGILNLLDMVSCGDTDFYVQAAEKLNKLEPSALAAYKLGRYFLAKSDFSKAISYHEEAVKLEEDESTKAKYLSEMSRIMFAARRSPSETRSIAQQALRLNPNDGEALIIIGMLYANNHSNISDSEFERSTAWWAAVDKFLQARRVDPSVTEKADRLISTYSAYFPALETIFFNDRAEGQTITVPGWINETTTIRARK